MLNVRRKLYNKNVKPKDVINRWKIVKGDMVQMIQGEDTGKQGRVLKVIRAKNKLVVEGLNVTKRHIKKGAMTDAQRQTQRFVYAPSPVHYSNVALVDPTDNKPTRIGFKFLEDGQKVRVSKRTGAIIPKPPVELKNEAKRTLNAKDTEPEYALLKTFDERTLNPLLLASQRHREWQLPNPFVFSGQGAEKQDREEKD